MSRILLDMGGNFVARKVVRESCTQHFGEANMSLQCIVCQWTIWYISESIVRVRLWRWWSLAAVEGSVISFFQKTWFLWWILATLIILRWFHLFSSSGESNVDAAASDEEQATAISGWRPSGSAWRPPFAV